MCHFKNSLSAQKSGTAMAVPAIPPTTALQYLDILTTNNAPDASHEQ